MRQPGGQASQHTELPSGLTLGTGVRMVATAKSFTQGNILQTGNALDVAINGRGFIQVLLPDGTVAYTRDGSFQVNAQGQLVTASGYAVQPAITDPAERAERHHRLGRHGLGADRGTGRGRPRSARCSSPTSSIPRACSPWREPVQETAASGPAQTGTPGLDGLGVLVQGSVESSNVNVVEELVNMIETQRAYEMNSKAITAADGMLQFVTQS